MAENKAQNTSLKSILLKIGFRSSPLGLQFDFGNCKLKAIEGLTPKLFYGISFLGNWKTKRSMGEIEFHLPAQMESYDQGIAFIAYYLRNAELLIIPEWLKDGFLLKELLPWEIEQKEYLANPTALIEHEWFRVIVKKLIETSKTCTDNDFTTFSFSASVLSIVSNGNKISCAATGNDWQRVATLKTKSLDFLPKRIPNRNVEIYSWKDKLHIGNRVFNLEE